MKIERITLWSVTLESLTPYYMANGKTAATVDSIVLRLDTDEGLAGWGEICPIPGYLPAYANGVAPAIEELATTLIGANPVGPEAVVAGLDAALPDHRYAKSAIDIALWDLTAKAAGLPLYALLGGRRSTDLPLYHSITCVSPEDMAEIAREAQAQGMTQFQAKLGADDDWSIDAERLRAVRRAVGPGPLVYGDWNCGVTTLHATRVGRAVADLDVMLEQPCRTLDECAAVRAATALPMKIDELAHDQASLLEAHRLGCMDVVAVKLHKFGGVSAARRARDLCEHLGVMMCVEDVWGSDIVTAAALHLAAATHPRFVLNVCDLSGYVRPRLDRHAPSRRGGRIAPPEGTGLGVRPDVDMLGEPIAVFS